MALIPPPPPLSQNEFNKRIAQGAKTLAEIDPVLARWAMLWPPFGKTKIKNILNKRIGL